MCQFTYTLAILLASVAATSSSTSPYFRYLRSDIGDVNNDVIRTKRHTPFLPDDPNRPPPDFGSTQTEVSVMVNGTVDLVCPIDNVQDSAVSEILLAICNRNTIGTLSSWILQAS